MVVGAIEGTFEIVRRLKRRGVRLYALTNFSTETFPLVRHRFEVFDLFDGCVVSGEVGVAKPDPEIYRHLLTAHGLTASVTCEGTLRVLPWFGQTRVAIARDLSSEAGNFLGERVER
jgi:phosphoglycolate phosphatase-like HAD superfamily hydrolase